LKPRLLLWTGFGFSHEVERTLTPLDFLNALRCGVVISAGVGSCYPAIAYQFLYLYRNRFDWGEAAVIYGLSFVSAFVILAILVHLFPVRIFKWSKLIRHREALILTMLGCLFGTVMGLVGLLFFVTELGLDVRSLSRVILFITTGACYGTLLGGSAAGLLELRKRRL